ncbi:hypothetical protein ASZ90_016988 [hydrocarbon metagenome]|uniref:Uncharacterized protein n=1 Tax=hydrocarbon metagenome TaxID=938273 RepID=A0A0W8EAR5_9ZZZZ
MPASGRAGRPYQYMGWPKGYQPSVWNGGFRRGGWQGWSNDAG